MKQCIEVYTEVDVGGGKKELIWWAGEVLQEDGEKRMVMISWDPLEDFAGWEEGGESGGETFC